MSPLTNRAGQSDRRQEDKTHRRLSRAYQDALRVADAAGAERVARQVLSDGTSVAGLYQRVIAPAMWRIGDLWEQGAISVADEHLATALTHQVMAGIYGPSLGHEVRPGRILLAAVEGEQHALGLRMAADIIELAGYNTVYLGADVPTEALIAAAMARAPDLIALAATMPDSASALDHAVSELGRVGPGLQILFGGQGARPSPGNEGAKLVKDLEHLLAAVAGALSSRRPPLRLREAQAQSPSAPSAPASAGRATVEESLEHHLSGIASETADLARSLARQANTYKDLAYTDTLSGLPNRRAFEDRAARLKDLADAKPLALLMLDLDGFKAVNDSGGHEAGDRMLTLMARTIAGGLREGDFVARLGGDEFAVLLPQTDLGEAATLAERLRSRVQDAGSVASVTASIGVAMQDNDVRRAMLRADVALYDAKDSGRNRVKRG
ncbi:MAG TPA: diguanylate cyclase [Solirubrobacterales bacterium]